jgi:hypothetical protein
VSKILRASAVVVAAAFAVPLWAVPSASAAEVSEVAANGAYFYSAGIAKPDPVPAPPPNVTGDNADGVSPGNLAVASQGGAQEDKVSFLGFDLLEVPLDATITKAVVTVPLVPASPPSDITTPNAAPELVRACKAGDSGFLGEDGTSLALAPARLCDEFSSKPATLSADGKAYLFDVSELAATWLTANDGLALTVAAEATQPFQVVFAPFSQARLALTYSGGTSLLPELPSTPLDTGSSGEVPIAGGFDTGGSLPSFDTGGFGGGSVESPVVDTVLPAPAPVAQTAPEPTVAGAQVTPVGLVREAPLAPSTSFWAGLLALVGIAGLLSLILGDPRVAAPGSAASQSRLSKALAGRQTPRAAGGPGLAARPLTV